MLKNRVGFFFYLMLRNDISWSLLSSKEKEIIHAANEFHNNERPDYANPDDYQSGKSFDSDEDRLATTRGKILYDFLEQNQPQTVIELGPGSGFLTRMICEHPAVQHYIAVDINQAFLSWLDPRLAKVSEQKPGFNYDLVSGDFKSMDLPLCDAVILLAAVHHIPDRQVLFKYLGRLLKGGGKVLAMDGSHYLPRMAQLLKKYFAEYHKPAHWQQKHNLSTHHFCTWEEYKSIAKQTNSIQISRCCYYEFNFPIFSRKAISRIWKNVTGEELTPESISCRPKNPLRFFSSKIAIEMQRF